jgi:hypothetical protein
VTHHSQAVADQPRIPDCVAYDIMMELLKIDSMIKEANNINDVTGESRKILNDTRRVINDAALRLTEVWYPVPRPTPRRGMPANDQD